MLQAAPRPTASGVGTVPERNPLSCPPPFCSGSKRTRGRRRTYRAPTPVHTYTGSSCSHQMFLHDLWICVYFYFSGPAFAFVFYMLTLTFGSIEFVATDGHQINLPVGDVDGNLSNSLSSISVEENSLRTTNPTCGKKGKCLIAPGFWSEN